MSRRRGPTLAERSAGRAGPGEPASPVDDTAERARPVVTRHCWVTGLPERPGRWAGLLVEWRSGTGGWQGRVVYAVDDGAATVLLEAWVPAAHLRPAPPAR